MKIHILFLLLFTTFWVQAQEGKKLVFQVKMENSLAQLEKYYALPDTDGHIALEVVKFYVTHLVFLKNGQIIDSLDQKYWLIDLENTASLQKNIPQKISDFDAIQFNIGVDSTTVVSGAFGGDLDPTTGMYWTWQSGYVNVKIEGTSSLSKNRGNRFVYHLGGYRQPFSTLQMVEIPIKNPSENVLIAVDLNAWFAQINIEETNQVMSLNQQAVELAKNFKTIFSVEK